MKKILIVSLFLLTMIGLMAQVPHSAVFDLETEAGGYHETVGFKVAVVNPFSMQESWSGPGMFMYYNWPGGTGGESSAATLYLDGNDPTNPGRILIQMGSVTNWGAFWGPTANVANFYFIDSEGNETGPYELAKSAVDATYYPGVVAWGGPVGPVVTVNWATTPMPADEATDVALDAMLSWVAPVEGDAPTGYMLTWNGGEAMNLGNVLEYAPMDLAYSTTYTWSVTPYVNTDARSREMVYPEGEATEWSFTTMAEPIVYPTWAANATPENAATEVSLMPTLTWTYDGPAADGYEVYVGETMVADVNVMTATLDYELDYNTEYTWGVKPYIVPARKGLKGQRITPKRYPNEGTMPTTTFTTMAEYTDETPVVIEGTPITVELSVVFGGPVPSTWTPNGPVSIPAPTGNFPPLPGTAGAFQFGATIAQSVPGTFTYTFVVPGGDYTGVAYLDGVQYFAGTWLGGIVTVVIPFTGGRDEHEVVITEPSLPVELSAFTAVAHADEYVTLNWVTESESNLQGYNVYRAETESFEQAMRINPTTVTPNNSTQTSNYSYTDNEVETATYYYWLEVAELSNENSFHGPIVVTVEDEPVVPGITETTFRNFGPSPFTSSTSTTLRVKEGETASVTIYNLLGQVVSRKSFNAGQHDFTFNGRDLNNKTVANGIYFVRMTSPTTSKSFKIVKIK